VQTWVCY